MAEDLLEDMFLAAGAGKQRLYIIPSMKLVVVRMGDLRKGMRFRDAEFLDRLLGISQPHRDRDRLALLGPEFSYDVRAVGFG